MLSGPLLQSESEKLILRLLYKSSPFLKYEKNYAQPPGLHTQPGFFGEELLHSLPWLYLAIKHTHRERNTVQPSKDAICLEEHFGGGGDGSSFYKTSLVQSIGSNEDP